MSSVEETQSLEKPCSSCGRPTLPVTYCPWCGIILPDRTAEEEKSVKIHKQIHDRISEQDSHILSKEAEYKFCPFCGEDL